jgi:hypothetical protein
MVSPLLSMGRVVFARRHAASKPNSTSSTPNMRIGGSLIPMAWVLFPTALMTTLLVFDVYYNNPLRIMAQKMNYLDQKLRQIEEKVQMSGGK